MFVELLIGMTAFLVAKERKESIGEMTLTAGISGLIIGLIGGLIIAFLLSPLITLLYGLIGITVPTTILDMLNQVGTLGVGTIFLSIIYSGITSAVFALIAVLFYELHKWMMKNIQIK
jgi:hypothetical protein